MEGIATSATAFIWGLHVGANDAVTNGTFALAFQRALDIAPEGNQAFNDAPGAEDDDLERP